MHHFELFTSSLYASFVCFSFYLWILFSIPTKEIISVRFIEESWPYRASQKFIESSINIYTDKQLWDFPVYMYFTL